MELDNEIKAVVVGLDTKFNYLKLSLANLYLQTGRAKFFATNED
jgi:ribonucleotide monophosphatase NagD (HAD superfamily)